MTIRPDPLSSKVIIEKHINGPLKGRAAKWYWACSVCGLVYFTRRHANVCCVGQKDRPWLKAHMKPMQGTIGRMVDGEFIAHARKV